MGAGRGEGSLHQERRLCTTKILDSAWLLDPLKLRLSEPFCRDGEGVGQEL